MSSDRQILAGLALKTDKEVRYFEVVQVAYGPEKKKCFVCIAKHSIIFMRQDLNQKINKDGELMYAHISKVIQDVHSAERFVLMLNENASWKGDRIMVRSESRELLLKHLRCCWQTDCMWRLNRVAQFPLVSHPLSDLSTKDPPIEAFRGHTWTKHLGYKFMLPDSFAETPNAIQTEQTGEYLCQATGVTVVVQVHEQSTLEQLTAIHREHIRWVAADYKANLVREESHFYVMRSSPRAKRMNLVRDSAAWYGWELVIRTRQYTVICLLLRRQYIPPLCDCAQDIAIIIRCPVEHWNHYELQTLLQAWLVADSVSPVSDVGVYRELVQAKLDGLRFDEDGIEWIMNHQKMQTRWRLEAKRFLRTILSIFIQSRSQAFPADALTNRRYLVSASTSEDWEDIEPIADFGSYFEKIKSCGEGLSQPSDDDMLMDRVQNRWLARLARYFAWAVDGGLLGQFFTLDAMIEAMPALEVEEENKVKVALMFMLHVRDTRPPFRWVPGDIQKLLEGEHIDYYGFNDRVMQQIISAEYLRKIYGRQKDGGYFKCLACVLKSAAGTSLKAYICRLFMEMRVANTTGANARTDDDANVVAVPALLHLMESGGVYLATFASAALVNLSHSNEAVKMQLMSQGLSRVAIQNIKSKDDDLISYTLSLLVNLTKEAHHRYIMANVGILPLLYDNLTSSYHQCRHAAGANCAIGNATLYNPVKEKILANLCSLIGHFCKDVEYRDHLIDSFPNTVKCLIYICTHCVPGVQLSSKTLYALKQLCAARNEQKQIIGITVIKPFLEQLSDPHVQQTCSHEYLNHALLLLQMLCTYRPNCILIFDAMENSERIKKVFPDLKKHPAAKRIDSFEQMIDRILEAVNDEARKKFDMD